VRTQRMASVCKGQPLSVGLDVHLKQWTVTVRGADTELAHFVAPPDAAQLAAHLRRRYPGAVYRSAYEAGFSGFWIHRELEKQGIANLVVHSPDVPTTHKERHAKEDRRDSRKLARELESDNLTGVFIPTPAQEHLRSLCRARRRLAGDGRRLKCRIKALFHLAGIGLPENCEIKHWSRRFLAHLETFANSNEPWSRCLRLWLDVLGDQRRQLSQATRTLRAGVRRDGDPELVRLLATLPGIAWIAAVTLATELIDIRRFRSLDHLAAFVGLVPATHSSGDTEVTAGLTTRANPVVRHVIIEAAWIAVRTDPELSQDFVRLCRRMRRTQAIVRIARKLLNRIACVWRNRRAYRPGVISQEP